MAAAMVLSSRTLVHRNPNPRLSRHSNAATEATPRRRKRNPTTTSQPTVIKSPAANLVMGEVKILKRGETLSAFNNKENNSSCDVTRRPVSKKMMNNDVDLIVSSTNRLGPEPETVKKQIGALKRLEIFAGAGCSISPLPSSVPIPCFLEKNNLVL
ncbi:PREDICTED: uncharacterized protein LOC104707897 [Camelina sativa]|uniref:Uncharacterized protein LOC104707897 n=1 Tax=Camelina sativa TaxID=90675 RepID=A0ABM1QBR4_CAMSA|nr:PREDICTED: uncharacterized protein LOC104707897 [Camelina sativa]XP_019084203.1 PREDICTED: uncharacterized protein LOC104707897 [Camelina sativa]